MLPTHFDSRPFRPTSFVHIPKRAAEKDDGSEIARRFTERSTIALTDKPDSWTMRVPFDGSNQASSERAAAETESQRNHVFTFRMFRRPRFVPCVSSDWTVQYSASGQEVNERREHH